MGPEIQHTELYAALLGLCYPWRVREVKSDLVVDRKDVWMKEATGAKWDCPKFGKAFSVYAMPRSVCGAT